MIEGPLSKPDLLTVMVFKENCSVRTFKIPFRWMTRLGTLLGLIVLLAIVSTFFSVKYFLMQEKTTASLKVEQPNLIAPRTQPLDNLPLSAERDQIAKNEADKDKVTASSTPPSPVEGETQEKLVGLTNLFLPYPPDLLMEIPDPRMLPFQLNALKMKWRGAAESRILGVRFILQYIKNDSGHQQGRIVLFARGHGILLAYPPDALHPASGTRLIGANQGELFSVSRFREVKADFGPVASNESLSDLEIFIFERNGNRILTYQRVSIPKETP